MSSTEAETVAAAPKLNPASSGPITKSQQSIVDILKKLGPLLITLGKIVDVIEPYFEKTFDFFHGIWVKLEPYHPEELIEAVFGIFLAFFGGHYVITLAAIEAYRMCGWSTTYKYLKIIWDDYKLVRAESRKDDTIDADNDGVYDVLQISKQELFTRKLKLAAKSCNPDKLSMAAGGLYTGFMGVIATLRVQFAQTVTLGAVIGGTFSAYAQRIFQPLFVHVVPNEYAKWVPVLIDYVCKLIGVSIAWFVQRVISAFYSAIRGANLVSKGVLSYAARHNYINASFADASSNHYAALTMALAGAGFMFQISNYMQLPFPFNIVFFPLSIVEYILNYFVAFD
mmetsp:Transcript_4448/g.7212  ORF Transcript_4448/g.7212 Transcript_4448/m.7212 type:complete len:340 (+) Transcript_4448:88-1107(+)|eukprot:CAMPEP_0168590652 /NCGR_PEP_ID=MMETSP0420-20121227/6685_1 /TAXON_ID=498008 /ORGANISM="Pessonella sp." /LENGTH=339 /DNA_ID=CAMNT_0008626331 /DNA_START=68 /DNA_END=1087 /DNA_ORIENTATION=+